MFVWAKIPEAFESMGSIEFSKFLLREARVATSPGVGFGEYGEGYIRFALIENEHRIKQAVKGIRSLLYSAKKK
jgi:alanine-synthesizing transaminase